MIPLVAPETLETNPMFAKLWKHVTTQLLDEDGSTRRVNEQRIRAWQRERVEKQRRRRASESVGVPVNEDTDGEDESWIGEKGHDVRKEKDLPEFEEVLHAVRVGKMKHEILREVLMEVSYLDDDAKLIGGELERTTQGHSQSRVPVRAKVEADLKDFTNTEFAGDEDKQHSISATEKGAQESIQEAKNLGGLRDLILIISAYIDASTAGRLSEDEEELLAENIRCFKANMPTIAAMVSSRLDHIKISLSNLASLTLEDSHSQDSLQSSTASLSETLHTLQTSLRDLRTTTLPESLTRLATTLQSLLTLQRTLLHLKLAHLETSKHGILSRHHASKIAFLSTVAQTMALKTQVMVLEARREVIMSPAADKRRRAINKKMREMQEQERDMDERIRVLEGVMGEYAALDRGERGSGEGEGFEIMKKLGRRYGEIEEEIGVVRQDIEMLERKRGS